MLLTFRLLLGAGLGRPYPRLDFIYYIDNRRSGEIWKGRLLRPVSVGWKESDEVPNGPRCRELFSLIGTDTLRVSARNREESLG